MLTPDDRNAGAPSLADRPRTGRESAVGPAERRIGSLPEPGSGERRRALKGHPSDAPKPQPTAGGWHPLDWACEFAGTAFQLALGFGFVALLESPRSPVRSAIASADLRLVVIGAAFGLLAALVALSPVGRRSGAHLNPAVTVGFALRGHTRARDVGGYVAAQVAGATLAALLFVAVLPSWAKTVGSARTAPEAGLPAWGVVAIEAGLTAGLLLTVFFMVSSSRTARWTPAAVTGALAALIWAGAPHTGASMNPARTFGPDLVSATFTVIWAYVVGPTLGAVVAVGGFWVVGGGRRTLTAKLFHDPAYPSVHATTLPAKPHRDGKQRGVDGRS